jgi:hypothetical protein
MNNFYSYRPILSLLYLKHLELLQLLLSLKYNNTNYNKFTVTLNEQNNVIFYHVYLLYNSIVKVF